ncbi:DUF5666 domain-containing protein [Roseococcus pinisoli]|uniref:DUF5666 domain-containing protein n=1 Tax=Roseococcus pinisoli TaxID=2835040 RepID=A0ABS5Q8L3_9PROT|nr:DUF5666 domain-containing protein [Roseococcus pinisoli]MBS7809546.1 hypothetical protein [Roseococcus pinisoli]
MTLLSRRTALVLGLGGVAALPAWAQQPGPVRLRGTITELDGNALGVATRTGQRLVVQLADNTPIAALRRVALSEITTGTAVGVVAEPGADGELRATAITVLPPGMRITELQNAWDTAPNASMNNGPVEAVVDSGGGRDLTLSILGRRVLVRVPADTPLRMPIPAARTDLVPQAQVFINATRGEDGRLSASRILVGKDGVDPVI